MDLMDMFKQQMTNTVVNQLTEKIGLGSQDQTQSAAQNAFSTLLGAVSKNAATEQGAQQLNQVLEKDHDGSILDNLTSFLSTGPTENVSERATNGNGILGHLLGNKQQGIIQGLSQVNKMSPEATQSLLTTVAPMVMGVLGKAKQSQGFDAGGLVSLLGQQQSAKQAPGQLGGLMSMLDSDGDGSVIDDIGGMLGGMFGK
ncbi:MAG: DUF937 domain-containing protein [Aureispira sp.]